MPQARNPVREMVREALNALGGRASNSAVKQWIFDKYPGTNKHSISSEIMFCAVNHQTRVYTANCRVPRLADDKRFDFGFRPQTGRLELYDPKKHGIWEIVHREDGHLGVAKRYDDGTIEEEPPSPPDDGGEISVGKFALESHLRDYLAANLETIEEGLQLYTDDDGNSGVEYRTPIGNIDILAIDNNEKLVVIELKVARGPDSVAGQVLRYKNWVKHHLAEDAPVRGIIIARHFSDRIKYAVGADTEILLKQYEMNLTLFDVAKFPNADDVPITME